MSASYTNMLDGFLRTFIHVEFTTVGRDVVDYVVVLLVEMDGKLETVRVYDGAHGKNELHRYTRRDGKQAAEIVHDGSLGEGMRAAIEQVEHGFEAMIWVMAQAVRTNDDYRSPAARVMNEAIELANQERSPYPERVAFLDAGDPTVGAEIRRAVDEDRAVVLVAADGSTRTLLAEPARS